MKKITHTSKKRQPKIKTEMSGKGLTVNAGLLPVLNFMYRLCFRKAVEVAVHKKRGANARYQFVDAVQMAVIGAISGATCLPCWPTGSAYTGNGIVEFMQECMAHIRTAEFWANAARFQCAVLAYNIMRWMALFTGGGNKAVGDEDHAAVSY